MEIIIEDAEKHIQINEFLAETPEGYRSFWQDLQNKYSGYEIDFCYHNCDAPAKFMGEIGANLLESCVEMRLAAGTFMPAEESEPLRITNENFERFAALHDKDESDMYWTSARVWQDLSRWCIFVCGDSYVMMSLWGDVPEIFALEAEDEARGAALLSAAVTSAFSAGKTAVLFMANEDAQVQTDAALSVGFAKCGKYVAYRGAIMKNVVILLNGPSSSGKSTLSLSLQKAILQESGEEYGIVSIDTFLKMATNEVIYEDDVYEISQNLCSAASDMLKTRKGVIIDHVITSERIFKQIAEALGGFDMYLIHVTCPLEELIRREKSRENRCLGSAESSFQYLYPSNCYDLTVDTFLETAETCSSQIVDVLKRKPKAINAACKKA